MSRPGDLQAKGSGVGCSVCRYQRQLAWDGFCSGLPAHSAVLEIVVIARVVVLGTMKTTERRKITVLLLAALMRDHRNAVEHQSPGSRSAPWVVGQNTFAYPAGVLQIDMLDSTSNPWWYPCGVRDACCLVYPGCAARPWATLCNRVAVKSTGL